jgi:phosphinothricin acetyltransferase
MLIIRPSQICDVHQITAIYAYHVLHGTGTFEIDPPDENDMHQRREDVLSKHLPYLVAVQNGKILGFAYCNWFKPRSAYRFCVEDSIYLAPEAIGQGLGKALLAELTNKAEGAGVRKFIAVIGDSANTGSIGVHRSAGFSQLVTLKSCGWKFCSWLDIVIMEKSVGLGDQTAPSTPSLQEKSG